MPVFQQRRRDAACPTVPSCYQVVLPPPISCGSDSRVTEDIKKFEPGSGMSYGEALDVTSQQQRMKDKGYTGFQITTSKDVELSFNLTRTGKDGRPGSSYFEPQYFRNSNGPECLNADDKFLIQRTEKNGQYVYSIWVKDGAYASPSTVMITEWQKNGTNIYRSVQIDGLAASPKPQASPAVLPSDTPVIAPAPRLQSDAIASRVIAPAPRLRPDAVVVEAEPMKRALNELATRLESQPGGEFTWRELTNALKVERLEGGRIGVTSTDVTSSGTRVDTVVYALDPGSGQWKVERWTSVDENGSPTNADAERIQNELSTDAKRNGSPNPNPGLGDRGLLLRRAEILLQRMPPKSDAQPQPPSGSPALVLISSGCLISTFPKQAKPVFSTP